MTYISASVEIERSPAEVWDIVTDPGRMKHWMASCTGYRPVDGAPAAPGSVTEWLYRERGRDIVLRQTVGTVDEPHEYSFRLDHDFTVSECTVRLEDSDGGTTVTWYEETGGKTFVWKLLVPLMKGTMRKRLGDNLRNLKEYIESEQ